MKIEYSDFKCPDGVLAVVGEKIVPFDDAAVAALAANAFTLAARVSADNADEPELAVGQ